MVLWIVSLFSLSLFLYWGIILLIIPPLRMRNRIRKMSSSLHPKRKKNVTQHQRTSPRMRAFEIELQILNSPLSAQTILRLFITFHLIMALLAFMWGFLSSIILVVLVDSMIVAILRIIPALRRKKMEKQLPEALNMMSSALKSGYSVIQVIELISKEKRLTPLSEEFALIFRSLQLGDSLERALRQFEERTRLDEVSSMVDAIIISREIGGNLTHVMDRLGEMIDQVNRLHKEIKSITAQGRMGAWIVGSLPLALSGILYLISPDYMLVLFQNRIGIALVCSALVMQAIGIMILVKMTKMKVR